MRKYAKISTPMGSVSSRILQCNIDGGAKSRIVARCDAEKNILAKHKMTVSFSFRKKNSAVSNTS
jgi:hypothetical protein